MSYQKHIKEMLSLSWPVIIGQVGHVMMGVVDNAMVGRVSPVHLAAASIANGLFFIILVIGIGISSVISPLVASATGAKQDDECGLILKQGLYVNTATGIVLVFLNLIAAEMIRFMSLPSEVVELAVPFSRIIGLTAIPVMLFQTFRQFIEGMKIVRPAMIITLTANLVNAFFNYLLVFGSFGFPRLELNGSGWATLIARVYMAVLIVLFVFTNERFRKYISGLLIFRTDKATIIKILRLGLPSGMQYFFEIACFSFAAIMVGWISANALAAHQIAISVATITYMAVVGISAAASIRVGSFLGAKEYTEMRLAGKIALVLGASVMAFFGIIIVVFSKYIPGLYVHSPEVEAIAGELLIIAALFQIFDGTQAVGLGVLRGITDVKAPTIITFFAYWIVGIPVAYLFGFILKLGVEGIWWGLLLGLAVSAFLLSGRFLIRTKNLIVGYDGQ